MAGMLSGGCRHVLAVLAVLTAMTLAGEVRAAPSGGSDRLGERMRNANCDQASRDKVTELSRRELDNSVMVQEQAIEPPPSVVDMGCLSDLESIDTDALVAAFDINSWIQGIIGGLNKIVCDFANKQWGKATAAITSVTGGVSSLDSALQPLSWLPQGVGAGTTPVQVTVTPTPGGGSATVIAPLGSGGAATGNTNRVNVWHSLIGRSTP